MLTTAANIDQQITQPSMVTYVNTTEQTSIYAGSIAGQCCDLLWAPNI